MNPYLPAVAELQASLKALSHAEMVDLAQSSTVPFGTLLKIRRGDTTNPGIETVRKFYALLPERRMAGEESAGV